MGWSSLVKALRDLDTHAASFAQACFELARADFALISARKDSITEEDKPLMERAKELTRGNAVPSWEDLLLLERLNLRWMSVPELLARRPAILSHRQDAWAPADASPTLPAKPQDPASPAADETWLRAELDHAVCEAHWTLRKSVERQLMARSARRQIALHGLALALLFALLSLCLPAVCGQDLTAACLAMLFGTLGAMASLLRRLQQGESATLGDEAAFRQLAGMRASSGSIYSGLYLAPVFALLTLLLFKAGLTSADLFPYGPPPTQPNSGANDPERDLARILIWAFLSGFSERFIPDIFDKLGSKRAS